MSLGLVGALSLLVPYLNVNLYLLWKYTSFHPNICCSMFDTECSVTVIKIMETFLSVDVAVINISDIKYSTLCVNVVT